MIGNILQKKPGNELQVLSDQAKSGLQAIDELIQDRNNAMAEVQHLRAVNDKLVMENEMFRQSLADMQNQRDYWMRVHAKLESNLNQLSSIMQVMWSEFKGPRLPQIPDASQIAEKFAPEKK